VLEFPLRPYVILSGLASLVWCTAFALAGHALGSRWEGLDHAFRYADYAVVAAVILLAALVVFQARRRLTP
jgi:membrane protein DedA with SNARE-associated domain